MLALGYNLYSFLCSQLFSYKEVQCLWKAPSCNMQLIPHRKNTYGKNKIRVCSHQPLLLLCFLQYCLETHCFQTVSMEQPFLRFQVQFLLLPFIWLHSSVKGKWDKKWEKKIMSTFSSLPSIPFLECLYVHLLWSTLSSQITFHNYKMVLTMHRFLFDFIFFILLCKPRMQVMGNSSYIVLDRKTGLSILHKDILFNSTPLLIRYLNEQCTVSCK